MYIEPFMSVFFSGRIILRKKAVGSDLFGAEGTEQDCRGLSIASSEPVQADQTICTKLAAHPRLHFTRLWQQ